MKKSQIILDCGIKAIQILSKNSEIEMLEISLIDLYNAYGETNNFLLLSKLFLELHEKGFINDGLSRTVGYYDSTDDIRLDVHRIVKK